MTETNEPTTVQKPKEIKFGKLRERVKKGELDPVEVLAWYEQQEFQDSETLVTWLKNQKQARRKKAKEKEQPKAEEQPKQKRKGKPRRKRQKKNEQ